MLRGQRELILWTCSFNQVGDQVEVAWKGKFRLESFEVYDGTAWWLAQVVGKGERPGYYQVICFVL